MITKKITEVQNFANGDLGTIIQVQGDEIGQTSVSTLKQDITNSVVSELTQGGGVSLNLVNIKGVVPTYADLPTIDVSVNDAYQVEADGLVYVYTESGFQTDGEGFNIQTEPTGVVEEGNTQAVSGGEVYDSALNLFESNIPNPMGLINPYYRYTGGVKTTYTGNENQILSNGELTFNIATSGTMSRLFQLPTEIESDDSLWYDFTIKKIQTDGAGSGIGFDNFILYRSISGGVRKITINPDTNSFSIDVIVSSANSYPLNLNDIVSYRVINGTIEVYVNGARDYVYNITENITNNNVVFGSFGHPYITVSSYSKNTEFKDVLKTFIESNQTGGKSNYFEKIGGQFNIYTHLKEKQYIKWKVAHELNMSELVYVDYWRLIDADVVELLDHGSFGSTGLRALTGGESEAVYRKSGGVDDATGGYHGDEILTSVEFFTDKGKINHLESNIPLTKCNSFFYIEKSTMHATATGGVPVDGHPIEALHLKRTEISSIGYRTLNRVTWQLPITVSHWNIGISCISKDFSKYVCTYELYSYEEMTGSEEFKFLTNEDLYSKYYGYNLTNGLSVYANSKLLRGDIPQSQANPYEFFVWDRSVDSKYYTRTPRKTVEVGEVWETVMEVEFK